jgi:hypothetical protein
MVNITVHAKNLNLFKDLLNVFVTLQHHVSLLQLLSVKEKS